MVTSKCQYQILGINFKMWLLSWQAKTKRRTYFVPEMHLQKNVTTKFDKFFSTDLEDWKLHTYTIYITR